MRNLFVGGDGLIRQCEVLFRFSRRFKEFNGSKGKAVSVRVILFSWKRSTSFDLLPAQSDQLHVFCFPLLEPPATIHAAAEDAVKT